jgi:hypothetical protein
MGRGGDNKKREMIDGFFRKKRGIADGEKGRQTKRGNR